VFGGLIKLAAKQMYHSNKEMMPIQTGLEKIQNRWAEIKQDTIVIHGGKDKLVHPKHLDFIEKEFVNAKVTSIRKPDQGHFILFEDLDMVVAEIVKLLD
jgi:pimeloyl-ACP methyl ester carboxylesterase